MAADKDLEMASFDIAGAFLSGEIELEGILVRPPKGFEVAGKERWAWKLKKPLYGLKQAPRCWKEMFHKFLLLFGFSISQVDDCLYSFEKNGNFIHLSLHVDDGLMVSNSTPTLQLFKSQLAATFESKWLDNPTVFLGFNIRRDRPAGKLYLSQHTYLTKLLARFDMTECKPSHIPLLPSLDLSPASVAEQTEALLLPYRGIIGGITWAAIGTRPDIAQALGLLSKHSSKPSPRHFEAAKSLLRYLKTTLDYCITYSSAAPLGFSPNIFSDANHAGCLETARSTTGFVVIMNGGAVHWSSKRQPTVALSTCEAEYMALTETSKHTMWLRQLIPVLIPSTSLPLPPTTIFGDNQGANALSKNPVDHRRTKHIHIRHHYIRELITNGEIVVKYVNTKDNVADVFTKGLDRKSHEKFCSLMGLESWNP